MEADREFRDSPNIWNTRKKLRIFRRCYIVGILANKVNIVFSITYSLIAFPLTRKHVKYNGHFALNSLFRRCVSSSEAWLSKLGYTLKFVVNNVGELQTEKQLQHRAVSLRQHGFLVV